MCDALFWRFGADRRVATLLHTIADGSTSTSSFSKSTLVLPRVL